MDESPAKREAPGCFFYGCLGAGALLLLSVVGVYFGAKKLMNATADDFYEQISTDLDSMDLPDGERGEADRLLTQLRDGVRSGDIGLTDLPKLVNAIDRSSLKEYAALLLGKRVIRSNAELSADEKADGELQVSRFADGMSKGKFSGRDFEDVLKTLGEEDGDGGVRIDDSPTAEELRAMIARIRSMADEAGLGQEGLEIDIVAELQGLVDSVMSPE